MQHPSAECVCAGKENAEDSGLFQLYFRSMRRALISLAAVISLGLAAATAAASFHAGTYSGEASGEPVLFTTDTHHAHNFGWDSRQLFDNAAIEHIGGVWRFHTHSSGRFQLAVEPAPPGTGQLGRRLGVHPRFGSCRN